MEAWPNVNIFYKISKNFSHVTLPGVSEVQTSTSLTAAACVLIARSAAATATGYSFLIEHSHRPLVGGLRILM